MPDAGDASAPPPRCTAATTNDAPGFKTLLLRRILPERIGMRHGDDVVAGIDEMDLAGDPGGEVGQEVEPGAAEVVEGDAATQRRMALLKAEPVACVGDA